MKQTAKMKIDRLTFEIDKIKEYILPLEDVGIEADYVTGMLISAKAKNQEDIRKIVSVYNPSELAELSFAGKANIPTKSPFLIDVGNWSAEHFPSIKVRYKSGKVKVWIEVPKELFAYIGEAEVTKQVVRGGDLHTAVVGKNYFVPVTKSIQRYSGGGDHFGSRVTYAKDEREAEAIVEALGLDGYEYSESHTS